LSSADISDSSSTIENCSLLTNSSTTLFNATSNLSLNSAGTSTFRIISSMNLESLSGYKKLSVGDFELRAVSDVYSDYEEGKELYFLDSENEPVRIESINKAEYDGKIYDVDVENDIVLVRRENSDGELGSEIWSGNSNNGTVEGDASYTSAGKMGGAFEFDGGGDYVDVDAVNYSIISFSFWVKLAQLPSVNNVDNYIYDDENYGEDKGFLIEVDSASPADGIKFYLGSDTLSGSASTITVGNWHHVVTTFNGLTMNGTIYVDGVLDKSKIFNAAADWTMGEGQIGSSDLGALAFNGSIDDVMIFNRSLSADEILALYNATSKTGMENNYTSLSDGEHTFKAYAQDLAGNVNLTDLRTMTINPVVTDAFGGQTTDFTGLDLNNVSGAVIDNTEYGKISFSENVSLVRGTNLSDYINVSQNRIELNSSFLTGMNKSATLRLYNLTFTTPRILVDGVVCDATVCTQESYTSATGILIFNVTGFSIYSSEETYVAPGGGSPGGGGGGGETTTVTPTFSVEPSYEKVIALGKIESDSITITNDATTEKTFSISVETLEDIISLNKDSLSLKAGESKAVNFRIIAPEKTGTYTGKIIVSSGGVSKEILVTINVKTEKSLFDITLSLLHKSKTISLGEELETQIDILQMGIKEKMDVTLNYIIKDYQGKTHFLESETIAVENQKTLMKKFDTTGLESGDYVLGIELVYPDGVAVTSTQFKVNRKIGFIKNELIMISLIFLIVLSFGIGFAFVKYKRKKILKIKRKKRG